MPKITVSRPVEVNARYLKAECGVRYWEDAEVNGQKEDDDAPTIPFASGDTWAPLIDIDAGKIVDWPEGTTASVHYKVCDAGRYSLLDENMQELVSIDGYVPPIMWPKEHGYGDYVIMDIGADGKIANWRVDLEVFTSEAGED